MKIFNWIATLWRGTIEFKTPLLFAVGFIGTFLIGGITGIFLAIFPVDWQLTDTYFVVAHFHYVLMGGAVFAIFAGLYYWFPKITGRMMSEGLGKLSFWLMLVGFNVTFLIQHSIGLEGMPRRDLRVPGHRPPRALQPDLDDRLVHPRPRRPGHRRQRRAVREARRRSPGPDPWKGNTLEWFTTSPPPVNNFDVVPRVRSVEPMKDIRRQVERQTAPATARPAPADGVRGPRLMGTPRAAAVGGGAPPARRASGRARTTSR